jgi:hypothetical protein
MPGALRKRQQFIGTVMTGNNCKIKLVWQFAPAKLGTSQLIDYGGMRSAELYWKGLQFRASLVCLALPIVTHITIDPL